jgi:uncharacterized cupin superfamily protein
MKPINIAAPQFEYDGDDPEGYRAGMMRLGALVGAELLGVSIYDLPPGQSICPYHYESGEEEWLIVLSGAPSLRRPDGVEMLAPWDVVCFQHGPEGAHKVTNETEGEVRVLFFSNVSHPAVTVYPDSDKIGVFTAGRSDNVMVRRSSNVGYYDGERGG